MQPPAQSAIPFVNSSQDGFGPSEELLNDQESIQLLNSLGNLGCNTTSDNVEDPSLIAQAQEESNGDEEGKNLGNYIQKQLMDIQHNRLVRDLNMTINEGEDTAEEMLVEQQKSELINEQDEEAMIKEILDKSPHRMQQNNQSETSQLQSSAIRQAPARVRPSPIETRKRSKSREKQQEKSKMKKFV
mmetsp:Transcript_19663/g.30370  ORF Transcript_19663/g.30370 Transcript_19663/m.30370 type:complete len:187 (-) Transcript_19663:53-613(-)